MLDILSTLRHYSLMTTTEKLLGNAYRSIAATHQRDKVNRKISGTATEAFWALWSEHKAELKAAGTVVDRIGTSNRWIVILDMDAVIAAIKIEKGL